jgi:hypothetical protein
MPFVTEQGEVASRLSTGAWWQQEDTWCMQLDAFTYARFPNWSGTDELRDALAWTIRQARPVGKGTQDMLSLKYEELCQLDMANLAIRIQAGEVISGLAADRWIYPGHLFIIQQQHPPRVGEGNSYWQQELPDVLSATIGAVWFSRLGETEDVLVYASRSQLEEVSLELSDDASEYGLLSLLEVGQLLTSALAEEALTNVRIAVSKQITAAKEIYAGMASAILAFHLPSSHNRDTNVHVFGQAPLQLLAQLATVEARTAFFQMLMERATAPMDAWPEDWMETVQAVLAANLNISEAARHLYVHRNTLLHKVERLRQLTGHDVRLSGDAVILYLASLIMRQPALNSKS